MAPDVNSLIMYQEKAAKNFLEGVEVDSVASDYKLVLVNELRNFFAGSDVWL